MKRPFINYFFIGLFLLQFSVVMRGQNKHVIDSLQTIINSQKPDTTRVYAMIALSAAYQGFNSDKAFESGNKALTLANEIHFKKGIGNAHNNLGDIYWYKANYGASSDHYLKALTIFEELDNKSAIANCYRNIGWIYFNQNNFPVALDYYFKALNINLALKNKLEISENYNDIGIVHTHMKDYDQALDYIKKSLAVQNELDNKQGMAACYGNMSVIFDETNRPDLAAACIEKSLEISEKTGNKQHLGITYCNLGSYYSKAGNYEKGIDALSKALSNGKELKYRELIKDAYGQFSLLYLKKKDYKKAYLYADSLSRLKDSIYNDNNSRQVNEMTVKYESEKKGLMISSLEKDNALSDEKLQREKNLKIYLGLFCLLIAGSAFVLFRGNERKKKANEALSHAYKEIEVKNKDITDSINYSKRIQEASLPSRELKNKLFPDAFILFKPKDIVSGDFYWYAEKNGKRLIAACDCTGHGVPGALMSMIGNNILHQIVNEKGITSPDEILNLLHKEIRKALKQHEQKENRDGMDIALLVFNSDTEVEFAGAQRPAWIISNDQHEPVLKEIKADKFSIGGLQTEEQRVFTKTSVSLKKGDSIYIFSDGYVDQFGGDQGKKFMTKNFKELLISVQKEPIAIREKMIGEAIEKWRGKREQVDDILVIGIKIS